MDARERMGAAGGEERRATGEPGPPEGGREMRMMRLSLAGTIVLALLGGLAGAALAQSENGPVHVTGTIDGRQTESGESVLTDEAFQHREQTYVGSLEMSDPRLSGEQWSTWNYDEFRPLGSTGMVAAGRFGVENDEGSWTGTFSGVEYPDATKTLVQGWLVGQGAYDGLSAYLSYVLPHSGTMTVEGMIFSGIVPPLPEPAE